MTTGTLIFLDTETTSLRYDRRVWEIGAIIRRVAAPEQRLHRFIRAEDLDLGGADPFSLDIGGYYQRHPQGRGDGTVPSGAALHFEADVMAELAHLTRAATIVGNVVNFDTEVLAARCRANGVLWNAHYHLVDVEALVAGYLAGVLLQADPPASGRRLREVITPPWNSQELSDALGVKVPGEGERHTAMGDAEWARDMYDAVMTGSG